jgi:predicted PurR-regulated permease PerM
VAISNSSSETGTQRSLHVGVGILAAGAAIAMLYFGRAFLITVIVASMIAFLLEPLVNFFMKLRLPRGLASFVVCTIALLVLYLAGLGIYLQLQDISENLPAYGERISEIVDSVATRMQNLENGVYRTLMPKRFQQPGIPPVAPDGPNPPVRGNGTNNNNGNKKKRLDPIPLPLPTVQEVHIQQDPAPLFTYLYDYVQQFYSGLLMASFVPFLVYFLLSWRDHLRSRYLFLFAPENRPGAAQTWGGVGDMVRAYVVGNFLLGLVLSVSSALLFGAVKLPYWLLVAPVSGFLSLIPYIGLPLALVPPVIAALPASKQPALYLFLTLSVAVLHLLAMNLLYPKLVGARVHLNPIVATVAIMFWGVLWGAPGLLLAIPLTAGLKAACDNVPSLKPYGRLLGD